MINRYSMIKSWENCKSLNLILELSRAEILTEVYKKKSLMQRKGRKSLLLSLTNVQGIQGVQNGEEVQGARGAE